MRLTAAQRGLHQTLHLRYHVMRPQVLVPVILKPAAEFGGVPHVAATCQTLVCAPKLVGQQIAYEVFWRYGV